MTVQAPATRTRISRQTWATLAVFAVLVAFYFAALSAARVYYAPSAPRMSTFGTEPTGLAALYRYLARTGRGPERLQQFETLPPSDGVVLVEAGPPLRRPTAAQIREVRRWVEAGGVLVVAAEEVNPFHEITGMRPTLSNASGRRDLAPAAPTRLTSGVGQARLDVKRQLAPVPDDAVVHVADGAAPLLVSRPLGRGSVVVLADEWSLSNAGISTADNLALALGVVAPEGARRIVFDEYHHGYASGGGALAALPPAIRFGIVQLLFASLVLVVARGRRLGTPREVPEPQRRSPMEYVVSLGALFRRAHAAERSAEILTKGFERELTQRYGPAMRDRAVARQTLRDKGLGIAAAGVAQADADVSDDRGLLAVARAITMGRQEVSGADHRRRRSR